MFRRPTIRSTVTTLAAAAVLVGGADLASYAATGHPLVLGHANSAGGTTSLKNTGRGPALSLNNLKSAPPLLVSSSKMVKHLNAERLHGKTASALDPAVRRFHLGHPNHTVSNTSHLFTTRVPKGGYEIGMSGFMTSTKTTDQYYCTVADLKKFQADDLSGNYTLAVGTFAGPTGGLINGTDVERFAHATTLVMGCILPADTGIITVRRPIDFTLRAVSVTNKKGHPLGRNAAVQRAAERALR
jgi:hypothetical protein